jgi:cytochrome c oxidase subunit 3
MDTIMTTEEQKSRTTRSYKLILLFAMVSMTMMFAGLTSAFVVSKSRADWLKDFQLPTAFFYSTAAIIGCSSHLFGNSKKQSKQNDTFPLSTLVLGILFVVLQFVGFGQIVIMGIISQEVEAYYLLFYTL